MRLQSSIRRTASLPSRAVRFHPASETLQPAIVRHDPHVRTLRCRPIRLCLPETARVNVGTWQEPRNSAPYFTREGTSSRFLRLSRPCHVVSPQLRSMVVCPASTACTGNGGSVASFEELGAASARLGASAVGNACRVGFIG
jgi:hypothetical protein